MTQRSRLTACAVALAGLVAGAAPGVSAGSAPPDDSAVLAELPPWQTMVVTDVAGEDFALADHVGRIPVLVEPFATWCSNCRAQLPRTNDAAAELGDAVAVVALSVETDLPPDAVAEYATELGFDAIRFAVMTPELLGALVDEFGNTVINPPATPKFVIAVDGTVSELTTGFESTEDLVAQLLAAGAEPLPPSSSAAVASSVAAG